MTFLDITLGCFRFVLWRRIWWGCWLDWRCFYGGTGTVLACGPLWFEWTPPRGG